MASKKYTLQKLTGAICCNEPGQLAGHKKLKIYGKLDCKSALRHISKGQYIKNRVFFESEKDAILCGYRPCSVCMPDKYKDWKVLCTLKNEIIHSKAYLNKCGIDESDLLKNHTLRVTNPTAKWCVTPENSKQEIDDLDKLYSRFTNEYSGLIKDMLENNSDLNHLELKESCNKYGYNFESVEKALYELSSTFKPSLHKIAYSSNHLYITDARLFYEFCVPLSIANINIKFQLTETSDAYPKNIMVSNQKYHLLWNYNTPNSSDFAIMAYVNLYDVLIEELFDIEIKNFCEICFEYYDSKTHYEFVQSFFMLGVLSIIKQKYFSFYINVLNENPSGLLYSRFSGSDSIQCLLIPELFLTAPVIKSIKLYIKKCRPFIIKYLKMLESENDRIIEKELKTVISQYIDPIFL